MSKCTYIKTNSENCQVEAGNKEFCFWHSKSPDIVAKRKLATKEGGKSSKYSLVIDEWQYENPTSIISLLETCINKALTGEVPPRVANSIAYLANALLTTVKETEFEKRLEVIEHAFKIKKQNP